MNVLQQLGSIASVTAGAVKLVRFTETGTYARECMSLVWLNSMVWLQSLVWLNLWYGQFLWYGKSR